MSGEPKGISLSAFEECAQFHLEKIIMEDLDRVVDEEKKENKKRDREYHKAMRKSMKINHQMLKNNKRF